VFSFLFDGVPHISSLEIIFYNMRLQLAFTYQAVEKLGDRVWLSMLL
jgi:hypothetical protein